MSRILIVDDDQDIARILRFRLQKKGHECMLAGNGIEALEVLDRSHPDLVLLDVMMPKMDGFTACREIRKRNAWTRIPVIMLTAKAGTSDKVSGISEGADDYVVKPFEFEELLARIQMVLRRTQENVSANPLTGLPWTTIGWNAATCIRQVLHRDADTRAAKVSSGAAALRALNPTIEVAGRETRLTAGNARRLLADHHVVIDGSDNFATRYAVNDACVALRIPWVHGSVFRFEGQVSVFWPARPGEAGPCYRCLHLEPPPAELAPSCAEAGVLGVVPGIIGLLQAIYSIPNIVMVLIGGFVIDRLGTKKSTFIFAFLCLLGAGLTAATPELTIMAAGRLIFGLGAASLIVAVTTVLAKWFRGKELSFAFAPTDPCAAPPPPWWRASLPGRRRGSRRRCLPR